jgi:hypothetical protein
MKPGFVAHYSTNNSGHRIPGSESNFIQSFNFEKKASFYKWFSSDFPIEIEQLLSGKNVTLYADINEAKYDLVKFNTIGLRLEVISDSKANETLNEALEAFSYELIHSGVSNFRFHQKKYMKYFKSNPIEVSPYTTWNLRLIPANQKVEAFEKLHAVFRSLVQDSNEISVLLEGKGHFTNHSLERGNKLMKVFCDICKK